MRHDPRTDIGPLDLGEFEHKGVADMLLLDRRLAYEELSRLAVMVGEAFRTHSLFGTVGGLRETGEATHRSEEHTSELQSLMRISYAVFCLNNKKRSK